MEAGVKFGKGNVTPQRERPYWEPPRSSLGKIDAHIEEIDAGDPQERGPLNRRQRVSRELWRRRAVVVVAVVVLVAIVAVGIDGSLAGRQPHPSPSGSRAVAVASGLVPSGSATDASGTNGFGFIGFGTQPTPTDPGVVLTWTAPPQDNPSDTPDPNQTLAPIVAKGWPVTFDGGDGNIDSSQISVGPNGNVYIQGMPVLDTSGHERTDWLSLSNGDVASVVGLASDGTIYASDDVSAEKDASDVQLYAFSADGKVKSGWPIDMGDSPNFEMGPAGTIYAFTNANSATTVSVLSSAGKVNAHWSVGSDSTNSCGDEIRPDGTLFYAASGSSGTDCSIVVYGPTGTRLSAGSARGWDDLTMSDTGVVVAVGYDYEPYSTSIVAQTRLALIGSDGNPLPGWPIALDGAVSLPAFGADGTLYVARSGVGTTASQVLAYDQSGIVKPGWPVSLQAGFAAFCGDDSGQPLAPVIGDDGSIYVAVTDSSWKGTVVAFDASGAMLPGWPYTLPQAFAGVDDGYSSVTNPGPLFVTSPGGSGSLYLLLDGEIVALGSDGAVKAGWPFAIPGAVSDAPYWVSWAPSPDGGLVVISEIEKDSTNLVDTIVKLTPDGVKSH
jgi:hypothetical protein